MTPSSETAGSRKIVTILFADLVGSTALHERLDPESARRFVESYYAAAREAVESHGGTVMKLLGDGVMAVFGIPRLAEDDAIRAVRAGVLLHTTVGIGYEVPWRQVEAVLCLAAERTEGLLQESAPFVLIKALGSFDVTYELNVLCGEAQAMARLYAALHRNILDVFNENGVQIMTPAYALDPSEAKVVAQGGVVQDTGLNSVGARFVSGRARSRHSLTSAWQQGRWGCLAGAAWLRWCWHPGRWRVPDRN